MSAQEPRDPIEAAGEAFAEQMDWDKTGVYEPAMRAAIAAYLRTRAEPMKSSPVPMAYRLLTDLVAEVELPSGGEKGA